MSAFQPSSNLAQTLGRLMLAAGCFDDEPATGQSIHAAPPSQEDGGAAPAAAELEQLVGSERSSTEVESESPAGPEPIRARRKRGPAVTFIRGISDMIRAALVGIDNPDAALFPRDVHARINNPLVTIHKVNTNIVSIAGVKRVGVKGSYRYYLRRNDA